MKKIIIIDDNSKNQREVYGASFVDEDIFKECLMHVEKVNAQSDFSFLDEALCVMMHDSLEDYIDGEFKQDSHRAKDYIEQTIQNKGIPYVLFSDGHAMTADWREETPNIVYSIKKSEFYLHLKDFVEHYLSSNTIDFRIIAFGKDFMKQLMSGWCQSLFSILSCEQNGSTLNLSVFNEQTRRKLRLIIENAQPKIGITFNSLMCDIEDGNVTVGQLRSNLNNIISSVKKYGKNISSWK